MKKLSYFLNYTPLKKLAFFSYIFWTILSLSIFKLTNKLITPDSLLEFKSTLKFGMTSGFLINLFFLLIIHQVRKSNNFWKYSKFVEELIDKSKNKSELKSIFKKEFNELNKKSFSDVHNYEVHRIYSIINTKYNNINE